MDGVQEARNEATVELDGLLHRAVHAGGSDLHLCVGASPLARVDGLLQPMEDVPPLNQQAMERILFPMLQPGQLVHLREKRDLDLSYSVPGLSRFRANLMWQRGTVGAVFRTIPARPLTLEELGMPEVMTQLASKKSGLVVVTGPTGSGKSTTLAAMLDYINTNFRYHIVTIEDPIEFLHRHKRSLIRQRELGEDTLTFAAALKHVLRQDPDVILVGEMRDLETISLAVTAAETGHLVFATLHTTSAATTVDRIIDVFPGDQQGQIRLQLSQTLQGVVSQTLLPRAGTRGRVVAMEIMLASTGIRAMIREGKTHQLNNMLTVGAASGMQTLNSCLKRLILEGAITREAAFEKTNDLDDLISLLDRP